MTDISQIIHAARLHRDAGRLHVAEPIYVRLVAAAPDDADFAEEAAEAALRRGNFPLAVAQYRRAIEIDPSRSEARRDLARALFNDGRVSDCIEILAGLIAEMPDDPALKLQMGQALSAAGRLDEAIAVLDGIAEESTLAALMLAAGRVGEAWPRLTAERPAELPGLPRWQGDPIGRVAVLCGNSADTIILFARFLPGVSERGATPVVLAVPQLHPILRMMPGELELVAPGGQVREMSAQVALSDLPTLFGIATPGAVPPPPRIEPDPSLVTAWRTRLAKADDPRPVVGVDWSVPGCSHHQLRALMSIEGVRFVTLCPVPPNDTLSGMAESFGDMMREPAEHAAMIAALDLVVSTDTLTAHLAGALDKPLWVLAEAGGSWWWTGGESSIWYPTARIIRRAPGQPWKEAAATAADALRRHFDLGEA